MPNFTKIELGALNGGKTFLKDQLNLTSCEISVTSAPEGFKAPFSHKHIQNEEVYIFIKGSGEMSVDGDKFHVQEGTCVKVMPQGCRYLENTGTGDLCYICVQAKENSLEQSVYSDGEKC